MILEIRKHKNFDLGLNLGKLIALTVTLWLELRLCNAELI